MLNKIGFTPNLQVNQAQKTSFKGGYGLPEYELVDKLNVELFKIKDPKKLETPKYSQEERSEIMSCFHKALTIVQKNNPDTKSLKLADLTKHAKDEANRFPDLIKGAREAGRKLAQDVKEGRIKKLPNGNIIFRDKK